MPSIRRMAAALYEARIDAACYEYAIMLSNPTAYNEDDLRHQIKAIREKIPEIYYATPKRTVNEVSTARGNFTW